jgi:hypothetical protein
LLNRVAQTVANCAGHADGYARYFAFTVKRSVLKGLDLCEHATKPEDLPDIQVEDRYLPALKQDAEAVAKYVNTMQNMRANVVWSHNCDFHYGGCVDTCKPTGLWVYKARPENWQN